MISFDALWADYARFMPALQEYYLRFTNTPKCNPPLPAGLTPADTDFTNPRSALFTTPDVLLSAGVIMTKGDPAGLARPLPSSILNRDFATSYLLADSGGYQVANSGLVVSDALRFGQLRWSEKYFTATLPVDVPSSAVHTPGTPYYRKFDLALDNSLRSLDIMDQHYNPANPDRVVPQPLLRLVPLQGHTPKEAASWTAAIIDGGYLRRFDGIAWGGQMRFDLAHVANTLLDLNAQDLLGRVQHIHFLGTASIGFGVMLTALKRALDSRLGRSVRVTFDASSPMQNGYKYNRLSSGLTWASGLPQLVSAQLSQQRTNKPYAVAPLLGSELGRLGITMDELRRHPNAYSAWDEAGKIMACNHNVEMTIRAIILANQLADGEPGCNVLPPELVAARKVLHSLFKYTTSAQAQGDLKFHGTALRQFKRDLPIVPEDQ